MSRFTIVTAVTPSYLDKLRWAAPTWATKPQFKGAPCIVYRNEVSERDVRFM